MRFTASQTDRKLTTNARRDDRVADAWPASAGLPGTLVGLAVRGLPRMRRADGRFAFTVRRVPGPDGPVMRAEGVSDRYGWIVLLGVRRLDSERQRCILGTTAAELASRQAAGVDEDTDLADLALATWATSEMSTPGAGRIADLLVRRLMTGPDASTVSAAWALSALLAAGRFDDAGFAYRGLLAASCESGLFSHALQPARQPRHRRHVACFADQVYPLQALARYAVATGDAHALAVAQRCADRICALQGPQGQWWWHYDVRTGKVVEGFPVYSVHQASMAPMALLDLELAGGNGHLQSIGRGLTWLADPPETKHLLIDERAGVVWRKIGRREPVRKSVRGLRSATTAIHPQLRLSQLDRVCPPGVIDHETRPYELGWSLMTWLGDGSR